MEFTSDIKKFEIYVHTSPVKIKPTATELIDQITAQAQVDSANVTLSVDTLTQASAMAQLSPASFVVASESLTLASVANPNQVLQSNPADAASIANDVALADTAYNFSIYPSGYGFVQNNKSIGPNPPNDFYLPIFLNKTYDYYAYVDTKVNAVDFNVPRQVVNPYFIEVDFFSTVQRNGLRLGSQLTPNMITYIKSRNMSGETGIPLSSYSNANLQTWFTNIGYWELPWDKGGSFQTTLDDIENVDYLMGTIRGKARFNNIDINK